MKSWIHGATALMILAFIIMPNVALAGNFELMQAFSLRITIVENGTEHEWEYDSPGHYEYETGSTVIKGKEAQQQVEQMVNLLDIKKDKTREEYAEAIKQRYPKVQFFDIRFMDEDDHLYTWGWQE